MTRIKFGDNSPETLRAVVVMKKAETSSNLVIGVGIVSRLHT
jgi:hypothetical protein